MRVISLDALDLAGLCGAWRNDGRALSLSLLSFRVDFGVCSAA